MTTPINNQEESKMSKLEQIKSAIEAVEKTGLEPDQLAQALALLGSPVEAAPATSTTGFFEIGKSYLIRTVTLYQVGRIVAVSGQFIKLEEASWIADTGRFASALQSGEFSEIEPVGESYINLGSIIDAFPFDHKLPTKVK